MCDSPARPAIDRQPIAARRIAREMLRPRRDDDFALFADGELPPRERVAIVPANAPARQINPQRSKQPPTLDRLIEHDLRRHGDRTLSRMVRNHAVRTGAFGYGIARVRRMCRCAVRRHSVRRQNIGLRTIAVRIVRTGVNRLAARQRSAARIGEPFRQFQRQHKGTRLFRHERQFASLGRCVNGDVGGKRQAGRDSSAHTARRRRTASASSTN